MLKLNESHIGDIRALTPLQEGMFFHYLENPVGNQYFEQLALEISGEIDEAFFEQGWCRVVETNEALRAQFRWDNLKQPVQIILKHHHPVIIKQDISYEGDKSLPQLLEDIKRQDREHKFDLRQVPFRVTLCKLKNTSGGERGESHTGRYLVLVSHHHILYDGWSTGIILKEFLQAYRGLVTGERTIPSEKNTFGMYVKWLQGRDKAAQQVYWQNYLQGFGARTPLPLKNGGATSREAVLSGDPRQYRQRFSKELTTALRTFAREREITMASLLYTAWGILTQKYTDNSDVVFGTTVAGRSAEIKDIEHIVGLFINTIPLRMQCRVETAIPELLTQIHETLKVRERFETTSLPEIKKQGEVEGKEGLFDTILVIENYPLDKVLTGTGSQLPFSIDSYSVFYLTNYDLTVAIETVDDIVVTLTYREGVFSAPVIMRLMGHFLEALRELVRGAGEDKTVGDVDILTSVEREQLLVEFNGAVRDYSPVYDLHRLFWDQVERTPDRVALVWDGDPSKREGNESHGAFKSYRLPQSYLSYNELNHDSNRMARLLRRNGFRAEQVVGIMMEPSALMVVSMLAILKAGGAYLPIDPGLPAARIRFMLADADARLLLTNSRAIEHIPFSTLQHSEKNQLVRLTVTPPRDHINGFDDLPMPDRSLIRLGNYKGKIGMASVTDCISIQTTRGCPFECLYCHRIWSKKHVHRSAENIFNEIRFYYHRGVKNFAFIDDCFNLNRENSSRLFQLIIREGLKVQLFFPNGLRGDIMTPDYIDLMAEAGTRGINLSLETASPRLQQLLKKHLDLEKFKRVVEYIAGQHPGVMLEMATMHGFPTETEEEAMMTLNFIKDIKWLHFPYIHILKIFPNTQMEAFALEHGIRKEDIMISKNRAFHELPETLPFPKSFTRKYQSAFMNDYFLNKERLYHVLPVQMRILSEEALAQKYNAYLPVDIKSIRDIIDFAGLEDMGTGEFAAGDGENRGANPVITIFDGEGSEPEPAPGAMRILFLDLSQHFSSHRMLYKVAEQPLGLIYLLTHLKTVFTDAVAGRIYKSGNDFDSYGELRRLVLAYKPHLVGIRTLTFFKEFFHETVSLLRQWGVGVPIITGGPYASSDYDTILKDSNIDLVVFGEGEETTAELIGEMLKRDFQFPAPRVLRGIRGIAFVDEQGDTAGTEFPFRHPEQREQQAHRGCSVMPLDHLAAELAGEGSQNMNQEPGNGSLAYVMYTSGSTGAPKGVMVEHRQVNNCIRWMQEKFHLEETDAIVQRTDLTFDPSVWEIFWPLQRGAKINLLTALQRKDARYLTRLLEGAANSGLTMMYCPASLIKAMALELAAGMEKPRLTLPWLIIGAEPIEMDVVKTFYSYYTGRIVNTYGPTECTINNTFYDLEPGDGRSLVPIGKPVANNRVFILSGNLRMMPVAVPGEIYIGGESVSRGYINKPELTSKHFLADGDIIYKTGDLGRWLEDGNIEFLGRTDQQVKIRGYRIELAEIERALLNHGGIHDCVALVRDSKEEVKEIKTCKQCGITSRYPGANIDDEGNCEMCTGYARYKPILDAYFKTPSDLESLIKEKTKNKTAPYDCLLLYSGGRGAAYALYRLADMGFRVLAVTYNNGYFSKADIRDIKKITAGVGVDHVVLTNPHSPELLKESLKVAHTVCRGCFHNSSSLALEYAYNHGIPVVVGATLSRGQIIENKLYLFLKQGITDVRELEQEVVKLQRSAPVMDKSMFDYIDSDGVKTGIVHEHVTTLDFYRYVDIGNRELIAYLDNRDPYWRGRKTYSVYSTNCPIKQMGDYAHIQQRGFHFYGSATSWEKRLGHISLENVREDLDCRVSARGYKHFLKHLQYIPDSGKNLDINEKYICAYIVSEQEYSTTVLREYLAGKIPGYMIPSYFVPLPAIPLTPVGKIDKAALPLPDRSRTRLQSTYVAPKSGLEKTMVQVWQEVLKVDKVGLEDNFFDLGGNSLDIVQVSGRLKTVLNREVPVVMIFNFPTVSLLARNLDGAEAGEKDQRDEIVEARRHQEREKGKDRLKQRLRKDTRRLA